MKSQRPNEVVIGSLVAILKNATELGGQTKGLGPVTKAERAVKGWDD